MATAPIHVHGTIERRDDGSTDWKGRKIVRFDVRDGQGRDVHLYVPDGHPLAALKQGDTIKLGAK